MPVKLPFCIGEGAGDRPFEASPDGNQTFVRDIGESDARAPSTTSSAERWITTDTNHFEEWLMDLSTVRIAGRVIDSQ